MLHRARGPHLTVLRYPLGHHARNVTGQTGSTSHASMLPPTGASIPRLFLHGLVEASGEEAVLGRRCISRISPRRRRASWSQGWICVAGQRQSGRRQQARAASAASSVAGRGDHRVISVAAAGRGKAAAALSLAAVRAPRIRAEVLPLETLPLQLFPLRPPALPLPRRAGGVGGTALPLALAPLPVFHARDESRVVVATLLLLLVLRWRRGEILVPPALLRRWRRCVLLQMLLLLVLLLVLVLVLVLVLLVLDVLRVLVPARLLWRGSVRGRFVRSVVRVPSRHVQLLHNGAHILGGAGRVNSYDRLFRATQLACELLLLRLLSDLEGLALEALQRKEDLWHSTRYLVCEVATTTRSTVRSTTIRLVGKLVVRAILTTPFRPLGTGCAAGGGTLQGAGQT